ncbi:unnamed protein product, partial [Symbiodinium pilosum]
DLTARRETGVTEKVTKEASQSFAKRSFKSMLSGVEAEDVSPTNQASNQVAKQKTMASVSSEAFLGNVESNNEEAGSPAEHADGNLREAAEDDIDPGVVQVSVDPSPETLGPSSAWQEVYQDGELVLYYSRTHGKTLLGYIQGPGQFLDTKSDELPRYDCAVGMRKQLRRMVPVTDLRPPFRGDDPVDVFMDDDRTWHPGTITQTPALALHHTPKFQVTVLDMKDEKGAQLVLMDISL